MLCELIDALRPRHRPKFMPHNEVKDQMSCLLTTEEVLDLWRDRQDALGLLSMVSAHVQKNKPPPPKNPETVFPVQSGPERTLGAKISV